ncbi:hypothetical protein CAPTEDRAFT_204132 [Capitella teleta]|uniref:C-type lectin domain-containing protein n=1 Tax=Capitella teleta TaxID=283909 RepID=R7UMS3_CAPTE|nr:hypothetical protein CAPTEDRAFT_204132 [Capitella teleta]|eukprot:ELU07515.1 hypothetical protein CAPTEDRAFT_204132 [Capitella teleta]
MMRKFPGLCFSLMLFVVVPAPGCAEGACASGWNHIDARCYKYFEKRKLFTDAKESCMSEGAMLAKMDTQKVNDAVSEFVRGISGISEFWIGITRANDQSEWRWIDDTSSSIVWSKWEVDEPDTGESQPILANCNLLQGLGVIQQGSKDGTITTWRTIYEDDGDLNTRRSTDFTYQNLTFTFQVLWEDCTVHHVL